MSIMNLHFQRVLSYFALCFIISTIHLHFWGAVMFFPNYFGYVHHVSTFSEGVVIFSTFCYINHTVWGSCHVFTKPFWLCPSCNYIFRGCCHISYFCLITMISFFSKLFYYVYKFKGLSHIFHYLLPSENKSKIEKFAKK